MIKFIQYCPTVGIRLAVTQNVMNAPPKDRSVQQDSSRSPFLEVRKVSEKAQALQTALADPGGHDSN